MDNTNQKETKSMTKSITTYMVLAVLALALAYYFFWNKSPAITTEIEKVEVTTQMPAVGGTVEETKVIKETVESPTVQTTETKQTTSVIKTTTIQTTAPAVQKVSVDIRGFAFSPSALTVKRGTVVTWTNSDSAPHTVTGNNGGPASGTLSQGNTYSYTFTSVGTFPYYCAIHPSMNGSITVTE